jgi:hypothetical protein
MKVSCIPKRCLAPDYENPGHYFVDEHKWGEKKYCDKCKENHAWCCVCGEHYSPLDEKGEAR